MNQKPALQLIYLPVNAAWVFLFRGNLITLSGHSRFFEKKREAKQAAKALGLTCT